MNAINAYLITLILSGSAALIALLAAAVPQAEIWSDNRDPHRHALPTRRIGRITLQITLYAVAAYFLFSRQPLIAFLVAAAVVMMIEPLLQQAEQRKWQESVLKECLAAMFYISGRIAATPLFTILTEMTRLENIPLTHPYLAEAVAQIQLNASMPDQLKWLARQISQSPEAQWTWLQIAGIAQSQMGQDIQEKQIREISQTLNRTYKLQESLKSELALSAMTKGFVTILIMGLIVYMLNFAGPLSYNIKETLPGQILTATVIFMVWAANIVTNALAKMPPLFIVEKED